MMTCSFCGKDEAHVAKLVAGPRAWLIGRRVYICDACVAVAARLMSDAPAARARPGRQARRGILRTIRDRLTARTPHSRLQQARA